VANWTSPKTWSTNEELTSSDMNTYVRDNTTFLHDKPSVHVYNSGATSIGDSAETVLRFDSEEFDPTTMHNAAASTLITSGSNGQSLPQATINVTSTSNFPSSGQIDIYIAGDPTTVTYTGKTSTTFTGCTGGTGSLATNQTVSITGRLTIVKDGLYLIGANIAYAANADGIRTVNLRKNGTTYIGSLAVSSSGGGTPTYVTVSTTKKLVATDYLEVSAFHTAGGAIDVTSDPDRSPRFWATWLTSGD
jgi:hypothetical protein